MEDFLLFDEQLSSQEKAVREKIRKFVTKEAFSLMPNAFENAQFPIELIPRLGELGLLGMTLPREYGGNEANYVSYGLACEELEWADSSLRSFVSVQSSLCMYCIFQYGTEEHKKQLLPSMAKGKTIACFALSELEAGSDPANMKTYAKKVSGGWRINGSKMWITNAPMADIAIVWAYTDDGIRAFLIDKNAEGLQRSAIKKKLSMRISATGELILENCYIPDSNCLPGTEKGLSAALSCLNQARYSIAWGVMGAARNCYEIALRYAKERIQFKKVLANFQLVQNDLVNMQNEIVKAQFLNLQLGRLKEQGKSTPAMVSLAKMNACKEALKIARMARNLLGAQGITAKYPVMRHMNNLESVYTYEGTDNIHHLIVGKYLTGCDAFS